MVAVHAAVTDNGNRIASAVKIGGLSWLGGIYRGNSKSSGHPERIAIGHTLARASSRRGNQWRPRARISVEKGTPYTSFDRKYISYRLFVGVAVVVVAVGVGAGMGVLVLVLRKTETWLISAAPLFFKRMLVRL
jgi:hypothetical protein